MYEKAGLEMALPFLFHPKPFAKFEGQLVIVISKFQAKIQRFQLEISEKIQKSLITPIIERLHGLETY